MFLCAGLPPLPFLQLVTSPSICTSLEVRYLPWNAPAEGVCLGFCPFWRASGGCCRRWNWGVKTPDGISERGTGFHWLKAEAGAWEGRNQRSTFWGLENQKVSLRSNDICLSQCRWGNSDLRAERVSQVRHKVSVVLCHKEHLVGYGSPLLTPSSCSHLGLQGKSRNKAGMADVRRL
jgi:hypothetical protein